MHDRYFRQQVVGSSAADRSRLNLSLYAVIFLVQAGRGHSCPLCMECDHVEEECAAKGATPCEVYVCGES